MPSPTPVGGGGSGSPPPPATPPCPTEPTITKTVSQKINLDTLNQNFPCAVKLIIDKLLNIPGYATLVQPFTTDKKPDLIWTDSNLAWSVNNGNNTYTSMLGNTDAEKQGMGNGATITLNNNMLKNSAQLLIAAAAIHETLHAYINYNVKNSVYDSYYSTDQSWMSAMNQWCTLGGMPTNFSNHFVMMTNYFDQAVAVLSAWDNNAHTTKEYAMDMLYGLDNPGDNPTPAMVSDLQQEYNNIKAEYGITDSELNTYWTSQLNTTSTNKLPGGC